LVPWWWMHGLDGHTKLMHRYQGSFGGKTTMFGDIEICPNDFGNYL